MAYPDLTTEQQASLQTWLRMVRSVAGELARVNNHNEVVDTEYNGTQSGVLAELLDADVIPVESGRDGAESLTKAEVVTLMSYVQGALAFNTGPHRQNLAKAAGEVNLIG